MASANTSGGKKETGKTPRRRIDWEAIERDYRTGKFSLRELEAKHGSNYADISRRAKKEGWSKDLREAVKRATEAALIEEVQQHVQQAVQHTTTGVVLAAAEVNKQVILGHRKRAAELSEDVSTAKGKLMALADKVADIKEAATLTSALEALVRSTKGLIEIERKAFNLDDDDGGDELPKSLRVELV